MERAFMLDGERRRVGKLGLTGNKIEKGSVRADKR